MASKQYDTAHGDEEDAHLVLSKQAVYLAKPDEKGLLRLYDNEPRGVKDHVAQAIHDGLMEMWQVKQLFDLQVIIQDKVFQCHRVIMASVSGYFRSLIASGIDMDRKGQATVNLDSRHVTPKAFKLLLQLFYKGKDVILPSTALEILNAASYLQMIPVQHRCVDVLAKDLGERNCLRIWEWADTHNSHALAVRAKNIALTKFQTVRRTEDFLKVSPNYLEILFAHDSLTFRYEEELLEAILDWVEYDPDVRRKYLKEFLPFVCFPYLPIKYLSKLRNNELIGLKTEFATYVDEALTFHQAGLQSNGRQIQVDIMARQTYTLKRLMPDMRRVVMLLGGCVVQQEPLTSVAAGNLDGVYYNKNVWIYAIASLPHNVGVDFCSAVWRNDVYISGGSRAPWTFAVYVVNENAWQVLGRLPRGREKHAMVQLDGRLYLLGGRDVNGPEGQKLMSEISMYDIEAKTWADVARLDVPVEAAPAAALGDKIYVFGGKNEAGESVSIVQCFDTKSREVSVVSVLPDAVDSARAAVVGKDIILVCPQGAIYRVHLERAVPHDVVTKDIRDAVKSKRSLEGPRGASVRPPARDTDTKKAVAYTRKPALRTTAALAPPRRDSPTRAAEDACKVEDACTSGNTELFYRKHEVEEKSPGTAAEPSVEGDEEDSHREHAQPHDQDQGNGTGSDAADEDVRNSAADENEDESDPDDFTGSEDSKSDEEFDGEEDEKGAEEVLEESAQKDERSEVPGQQKEDGATFEESTKRAETSPAPTLFPRKVRFAETPQSAPSSPAPLYIRRLTTMKKRQDFGIFVRKADVYVVGGQAENGDFLDDILLIHVPSAMTYIFEGRLAIPMSCLQAEMTVVPYYSLMQVFDATNCFNAE